MVGERRGGLSFQPHLQKSQKLQKHTTGQAEKENNCFSEPF